MPGDLRDVYWDSSVFLSYFRNEAGRADIVQTLLDHAAGSREIRIFTSMITIVEVAFAVSPQSRRDNHDRFQTEKIDALWDSAGIHLVEFSRFIAEEARDLCRQAREAGQQVSPPDAIHLATARRHRLGELHTFDGPLLGHPMDFGVRVGEPQVAQQRLAGL